MPNYRRWRVPGGSYFFTVALHNRRHDLLTRHIDDLRGALRAIRASHPFTIDAIVVLPEHLHCIWTLPPGDGDYSTRWRQIKARFTRGMPATEPLTAGQRRRGERRIWQPRFWEHVLRDEDDYTRHFDYIHHNLVKHELVDRAVDWPFSSFHRWVRRGLYDADWGGHGSHQELRLK